MDSIALALASLSFAFSTLFTLVGGGTFIYIAIKVIRTSDEFARKADSAVVETKADTVAVTNSMNKMADTLGSNISPLQIRIEAIEELLEQLKTGNYKPTK